MDKALFEEPEFFISDTAFVELDEDEFEPAQRQRRPRASGSASKAPRASLRVSIDFARWRRVAVRVIMLCMIGGLGYGGWFVQRHHTQWCPIREVRIEGAFVYLEREQFARQIEPVVHGGFFNVDLDGIKEAAAKLPWVDSIVIQRMWPDTLVIQVTEKRALARWKENALISDRGKLFYPGVASFPPGLVSLNGPEGSERKVYKALQRFEAQAKRLPARLSQVTLDARGGWHVRLADGVQVTLGKEVVYDRFARFVNTYAQISQVGKAPVESVDMRYRNGFAVAFQSVDDRVGLQGTR